MMGIDLVGPLKKTSDGNTYIFTATDFFTKWTEAFPIPSKNAEEIAKCIMKLFFRHGACHAFLSDNGGEFVNEVKLFSNEKCFKYPLSLKVMKISAVCCKVIDTI